MSMFTSSLTRKRWKVLKKGLSYVKSIVLTVTVFNKTQTLMKFGDVSSSERSLCDYTCHKSVYTCASPLLPIKKLFHFIDTMNGNFNKIINIDFSCQIFQKEI